MVFDHGIITNIQHFSVDDGPGIRTTVFFKGCSLRCLWCHNPETISPKLQLQFDAQKCIGCKACATVCSSGAHSFDNDAHLLLRENCTQQFSCAAICPTSALTILGKSMDVASLLNELLKDQCFYKKSGGGVTLSGGEPLLQAEYCSLVLEKLQMFGIHTAIDTAGNVPWEAFEKTSPFTSLYLFDVKAASADLHRTATGVDNSRICSNLMRLSSLPSKVWIRVPLIPGINDDEAELTAMANLIRDANCAEKVQILPYHAMGLSKYEAIGQDCQPHLFQVPSREKMEATRDLFLDCGVPQTEI